MSLSIILRDRVHRSPTTLPAGGFHAPPLLAVPGRSYGRSSRPPQSRRDRADTCVAKRYIRLGPSSRWNVGLTRPLAPCRHWRGRYRGPWLLRSQSCRQRPSVELLRLAAKQTSAGLCIDPPLAPWRCPRAGVPTSSRVRIGRSPRRWSELAFRSPTSCRPSRPQVKDTQRRAAFLDGLKLLHDRPQADGAARQPVDFADYERVAAPKVGQRPIKLGALADARHLLSKNLGASGRLEVAHLCLE